MHAARTALVSSGFTFRNTATTFRPRIPPPLFSSPIQVLHSFCWTAGSKPGTAAPKLEAPPRSSSATPILIVVDVTPTSLLVNPAGAAAPPAGPGFAGPTEPVLPL